MSLHQNLRREFPSIFVLLVLTITLLGCGNHQRTSESQDLSITDCTVINQSNSDKCLRLNHIQVLGTHNSYKLLPHPNLVSLLNESLNGWSRDIEYEHKSLTEQLTNLGIRKIELDIFADPNGGLYSNPSGALLSQDFEFIDIEKMNEPGFKVIHIQDIDYRSTCLTFISCLDEIKTWSESNPNHLPIMIMVEAKEGNRTNWGNVKFTPPVTFDVSLMNEIDQEILEVFELEKIITPDVVRGNFKTLEEAILNNGWPTLEDSRGKVLFALDNTGHHRTMYLSDTPNLEGRILFISSESGEPTAAFIKMNDSISQAELIKTYATDGFLIRTRTDTPTNEARSGNTRRKELAFESGAHYLSTDYPEISPFGSGYIVQLPDTNYVARCNPITAPVGCRESFLTE